MEQKTAYTDKPVAYGWNGAVFATRMLLCLLVVAGSAIGIACAQETAPEASPVEVPQPPTGLETPRATVATFLAAMESLRSGKNESRDTALMCIDLDEFPEITRQESGIQAADYFFDLMEEIVFRVEDIPDKPEKASAHSITITLGSEERLIKLVLKRGQDDLWRFSLADTQKNQPAPASTPAPVVPAPVPAPPVVAEVPTEMPPPPPAEMPFDPRFRTPRFTLRTYIFSMNDWRDTDMADAMAAFDLSTIENARIREEKGRELAVQLMMVLNRTRYIRLNEVPNQADLPSYAVLNDALGAIELKPVTDEKLNQRAWKFTASSVDLIPVLYDFYRDEPLIGEVKKEDLPQLASLRVRDWVRAYLPFLLRKTIILENYQWLGLFTIILTGMVISRVVGVLLGAVLKRSFQRFSISLEERLQREFIQPIRIALMAWVWLLGLAWLGLPAAVLEILKVAAQVVTVGAAVWAGYRLVDIVCRLLEARALRSKNKFDDLLVSIVSRGLKIMTVMFGLLFIADTLGYEYKSLLAGLGIGGLAFALAAKETVANIFGSLTVLMDRPFHINDYVNINNIEGTVETVGIRSTRIRTLYNSLVTVPNSELISARIDNLGARMYRRTRTMLSITYGTPPEKIDAFCEGIREIIRLHPYTRKDMYYVYLSEFAPASLNVLVHCFHETQDYGTELRERHRLYLDIIRLAKRLGVEFAFPTQTLYLHKEKGLNEPVAIDWTRDPKAIGRKEASDIFSSATANDEPPPAITI